MKKSFLLVLFASSLLWAKAYYISVTGSSDNDGSIENPWSISAFSNTTVAPGDTLYLRSGVYIGDNGFWVWVNGTEERPIVIKPYNYEKVILKGDLPPNLRRDS